MVPDPDEQPAQSKSKIQNRKSPGDSRMRRVLTIAAVLALMALAGAGYAADDKVALAYKALSGQSARYKTEGTMSFEGGPGPKVAMEMKEIEKVTFTEVKHDGTITMEREGE